MLNGWHQSYLSHTSYSIRVQPSFKNPQKSMDANRMQTAANQFFSPRKRPPSKDWPDIDKAEAVVMMKLLADAKAQVFWRPSRARGCSLVVKFQPSKLAMWVRFPSPAPL
jgi:hypothetical protein